MLFARRKTLVSLLPYISHEVGASSELTLKKMSPTVLTRARKTFFILVNHSNNSVFVQTLLLPTLDWWGVSLFTELVWGVGCGSVVGIALITVRRLNKWAV